MTILNGKKYHVFYNKKKIIDVILFNSAQRHKEHKVIQSMSKLEYNIISKQIIKAAIEVHKELGAGLLESVYEHCLFEELKNRNKILCETLCSLCLCAEKNTIKKIQNHEIQNRR